MRKLFLLGLVYLLIAGCVPGQIRPASTTIEEPGVNPGNTPEAYLPNPASVYCLDQGFQSEIRTAADDSQYGVCIFPDGSECDEWAYYRGECAPPADNASPISPTAIPTVRPIDPNDYQGWWTYTHPVYDFSIKLPEDWKAEEVTTSDPLMNGHALTLSTEGLNIRMTFRREGEDIPLWPTGVGSGEFVAQGTLEVAGEAARRMYFICPNGAINAIWYHGSENMPQIQRGDLEFGFIFSLTGSYCEEGRSLDGKAQYAGEMIIASLSVR